MSKQSIPDGAFVAMKANYHRQLGRLSSHGMAHRVEQGGFPGRAPLGYRNVTNGGDKAIITDETIAPLIRQLFEKAAEGEYSISQLQRYAKQIGLVSRQGKTFGKSSLWKILTNPFYSGLLRYKGEIARGLQPAIISKETFAKVQSHLKQRRLF